MMLMFFNALNKNNVSSESRQVIGYGGLHYLFLLSHQQVKKIRNETVQQTTTSQKK